MPIFSRPSLLPSGGAAAGAARCWCRCARFTRRTSKHHIIRAGRHFITGVHFYPFHGARERLRHRHRGLVAFDGDQRDRSASTVSPTFTITSHFNFVTADIRNVNVFSPLPQQVLLPEPLFFSSALAGAASAAPSAESKIAISAPVSRFCRRQRL